MAYQKTTWIDDTAPYLNAVNLNNLETGLESASAKADTNANDIAVNTGNINANTTKINANTTDIATIKSEQTAQNNSISANGFSSNTNAGNIQKNADDISALSTGEVPQGDFTPIDGAEYPTDEVEGYSWYISGVAGTGYLYTTGVLAGETAMNMDKIMYTVNGWSLVQNALTTTIENMAIGDLQNTILEIPFKNNLDVVKGNGEITFTRASTATYIDTYGVLQTAEIDEPRFEKEGILLEGEGENLFLNSDVGVTQNITVTETTVYTVYFLDGAGDITLGSATIGTVTAGRENAVTFTSASNTLSCTVNGVVNKVQVEASTIDTSYIPTLGTPVIRDTDLCSIPALNNLNLMYGKNTFIVDTDIRGILNSTIFTVIGGGGYRLNVLNDTTYRVSLAGANLNFSSITEAGKLYRFCLSSDAISLSGYIDGIFNKSVPLNTALDIPTTITFGVSGSTLSGYGHIANFKVYADPLNASTARLA